jgi:hypothetical protein
MFWIARYLLSVFSHYHTDFLYITSLYATMDKESVISTEAWKQLQTDLRNFNSAYIKELKRNPKDIKEITELVRRVGVKLVLLQDRPKPFIVPPHKRKEFPKDTLRYRGRPQSPIPHFDDAEEADPRPRRD